MSSKERVLRAFQQAIKGQESSGGNYTVKNASGAAGAYQFMPDTWNQSCVDYGYGDYANGDASTAPAEVQDAVFMAYASDLYDTFNGDIRYMANAHYAGINAALKHYEEGYLPTADEGDYPSQEKYAQSILERMESEEGEEPKVSDDIDWTNLVHNHVGEDDPSNKRGDGQKMTNTDDLRGEAKYGLNVLGKYVRDTYGEPLIITGGAETWTHEGGEFSHHSGWKADVYNDNIKGNTPAGNEFKEFCNNNGWSANWEKDHWDIDFSGNDTRDPQKGKQLSGDWMALSGADSYYKYKANGQFSAWDIFDDDINTNTYDEPKSTWDMIKTNFMDSMTNTGFADFMQSLWGGLAHSDVGFGKYQPVTQEDIDYVKQALPNDKEARDYCLLHGRDSKEIKWLVNQKLVDQQRRAEIAQWKAGSQSTIDRALVAIAGGAGYLVDPINLIPIGGALTKLKMLGRLGEGLTNLQKASIIAGEAAKDGVKMGAVVTADDYLKDEFGGKKQNYAWDAALGFLGGAVLSAAGGLWKGLRKGGVEEEIVTAADRAETVSLEHAAGRPQVNIESVMNETHPTALKLHNTEYGKGIKSKIYQQLEAKQKVVATTFEDAYKLLKEASGKQLPKEAKALYVPNEDYTILLTDRIKPQEVDGLLAHEIGVHGGLQKALGDKAYAKLMAKVAQQSRKEGTVEFDARAKAGSYDPEEILAQMVEDNQLGGYLKEMKGAFNSRLNREGYGTKLTQKDFKEILEQQVSDIRHPHKVYFNDDGSTIFAGLRYSKDNMLNVNRLADFLSLEQQVTKETQRDIWKPLQKITKALEMGIFGKGINSTSNTMRKYTPWIWSDARGRQWNNIHTITAEDNKERLVSLLVEPYLKFANERMQWGLQNKQLGYASNEMFNRMVINRYNAKYAGNKANMIGDIPPEVDRAVEHLRTMRQLQIELGKRSADDVGSTAKNLIDKDWYEVDAELWRTTDFERKSKFAMNYTDTHEKKAVEQMREDLEEYYRTFAKRDVIKEKIIRSIRMENSKIKEANEKMRRSLKGDALKEWKDTPLKPETVLDEDIDRYLDEHIPNAVDNIMNGIFDPTEARNLSSLGNLSFFKDRIPIDTTGVMKLKNGKEFSFDNDLRTYDLDDIVFKNINRFAGEASLLNVFKNQKNMEAQMQKMKEEIQTAIANGYADKSALNDISAFERSIAEFRGVRPENGDEVTGKFGSLLHIFRNLAYAKDGANMGFNQFGELGGTIAYGGAKQLFRMFKPMGEFMENVAHGKANAEVYRDIEDTVFGARVESQIFTVNWRDYAVRNNLTDNSSLTNKALIWIADKTNNLGKVTSAINMLPKMTDSMVRGMRVQGIADSIRWARGESVGMRLPLIGRDLRNPFSKAKLKAANVSPEDAEVIKKNLTKFSTFKGDTIKKLDVKKWQEKDMRSFLQWYNLIQKNAERAITSASRQGNKNLLKSKNSMTQLMFQFKDYMLRSINAQSLRAMTARDLDDGMATALSVLTNFGIYCGRAGLTYGAYKASGLDEKAEKYYQNMFSDQNLLRAAITRSTFIGSPASFVNDAYEAIAGAPTVRTTVERSRQKKDRDASDIIGDFVSQFPAVAEAFTKPLSAMHSVYKSVDSGEMTKKDYKNLLNILPMPNFIPFTVMMNKLVEESGYPDKRRNK